MAEQEFIRGLQRLEPRHQACVATIGSFDGVHLGHQQILERLKQKAHALKLPSLVIIFEPQPQEYFARAEVQARLTRLREKVNALFESGIDRVLCLRFDQHLRGLSAKAFIDTVLIQGLAIKHLVVGDDFRFGCDRQGDFSLLLAEGKKQGYSVESTKTFELVGERVSSTRIRALLEVGDLTQAAELLGRPYCVTGRVCFGKQLGRTIGVATANISLGRKKSPIAGVFAVRVQHDKLVYEGVANVGVKPSLTGKRKPNVEVHIFDFEGDLYGETLNVCFLTKLREEKYFESLDHLKQQIGEDIAKGRAFFAKG